MRRAVGVTALSLPFVLAFGSIFLSLAGPAHALPHPLLERSISDYYHTPMRNYLVGSLFAIAAFLACTRGYDLRDEITGYVAGGLALIVALVPSVNPHHYVHNRFHDDLGRVHLVAAASMFFVLAYFCLVLFRKTSSHTPLTRRKRHRNSVFLACGVVMVVCMSVMLSLTVKSIQAVLWPTGVLFWCESLALFAFGVAWLIKGEVFLRDWHQNLNRQNHDLQRNPQLNQGHKSHAE
jgi:hypothetical protein